MTAREGAVISAYTGVYCCNDLQVYMDYIEEILGHPVSSYESMTSSMRGMIRKYSEEDFQNLIASQTKEAKKPKDFSNRHVLLTEWMKLSARQKEMLETEDPEFATALHMLEISNNLFPDLWREFYNTYPKDVLAKKFEKVREPHLARVNEETMIEREA